MYRTTMITAKGKQLEWHEQLTIRELLRTLGYKYSTLLIRVNGNIVGRREWDTFVVPDEAQVEVRPIVAGG
jgi:thiamine biosynthesis protein ThiS